MTEESQNAPIEESVPKSGSVAVGEDLEFQRHWWAFERAVWIFFLLVLVADVLGLLGRGPLAKAERRSADGLLNVHYERVERATTPSTLTIQPSAAAVQNGAVHVFVGEAVLRELGSQRIDPQPASATVGNGGVTFVFPSQSQPSAIQFQLAPQSIGVHHFTVACDGGGSIQASVLVLP
jgi:hypothetical protein